VTARDPATGLVAEHTVTNVDVHTDPEIEHLQVDGETIETTPNHRFLTDHGWVEAAALYRGMSVIKLDGTTGTVEGYSIEVRPVIMWDLTVSDVHTFAVGDGQWVVHNAGPCSVAGAAERTIHGNADASGRWTSLYELTDTGTGRHLKYGISADVAKRYTSTFLSGRSLDVISEGPRGLMRVIERALQEGAMGELAREPWAGVFDRR
jgi:hypothetical protein